MKKQIRCPVCKHLVLKHRMNPHLQSHGFHQAQRQDGRQWWGVTVWVRLARFEDPEFCDQDEDG